MSNDSKSAAAQEAVAWFTDDHLTDRSATTYDAAVAERWRAKGWPVTPLYAAPVAAAPVDLHAHLLHMLGARDHEDAGRIIGELHAASMSTPAAPGIDPADPWRGLYAQELMPKLDGVGDYFAVHPDVPEWPDDDERSIAPLIVAQGFTHYAITADYPWDEGEPGEEFDTCAWLANWKPEPPAGEQWRLVMIQDTEDGPAAVFVRPLALIDASPAGGGDALARAYGYLWHVNHPEDIPTGHPYMSADRAAVEARKELRDMLTHEQRGEGINCVRQKLLADMQATSAEVGE